MDLTTSSGPGGRTRVRDPAGLLYGALVAASVLGVSAKHGGYGHVALATLAVLGVYWLAHVYTEAQAMQANGDQRSYVGLVRHAAAHEVSVIQGGLPAIAVFALTYVLGASITTAATVAVWFSVAVLFAVGLLTARQAGRQGALVLVEALAAAALGVLVILAKGLLH